MVVGFFIATNPATGAVPAATSTTSVITVKVGGDRNGPSSVAPLQGVTLALFNDSSGSIGTDTGLTCVSDPDGDCSFTISGTGIGKRYWVQGLTAPTGYYMNADLDTGALQTAGTATPYRFLTPAVAVNKVYKSTVDFMGSGSGTKASSGTWQVSRNNPTKTALRH